MSTSCGEGRLIPITLGSADGVGVPWAKRSGWAGLRIVLDRLKAGGWVDGLCSWPRSQSCAVSNDNAAIARLGPIITLRDSTRIAADADIAVDVMLTTPCPAPPESERCRVPDAVEFRYFLRAEPDGTYRVMTRQLIGAI